MLPRLPRHALLALSLLLTACGGGGGTEETTEAEAGAEAAPTPEGTGFDPELDPQLQQLAGQANAAPAQPAPQQEPALVALGQALFFDRLLSGNRDISCATCHDPSAATGDALSVSIGTGGSGRASARQVGAGLLIPRNSPPLFRLERQPTMFWDSRVERRQDGTLQTPEPALNGPAPSAAALARELRTALAAQAMFPVTSHAEMRGQPGENEIADASDNLDVWDRLSRRLVGSADGSLSGVPAYRDLFARAYPAVTSWDDVNFAHAARAIAAFEVAAFSTRGAPFDAWLAGDAGALSAQQKRGGILFFGRADCSRCHGGPAFTDGRHHAIGVPQVGPGKDFPLEDTGRALVTGNAADRYRFRTPSLRNVALTGPWMHDGAYTTLTAAVAHYRNPTASLRNFDAGQLAALLQGLVDRNPARQDARALAIDNRVRDGTRLNDGELADLVAFLNALTDASARDLSAFVPASVPSGLPLDD